MHKAVAPRMMTRGRWNDGHRSFVPRLPAASLLLDVSLELPLHARVRAQRVVHDEVVQDSDPRGVLRQVVVILGCDFLHLETKRGDRKNHLVLPRGFILDWMSKSCRHFKNSPCILSCLTFFFFFFSLLFPHNRELLKETVLLPSNLLHFFKK